jgi:hypothetical protein
MTRAIALAAAAFLCASVRPAGATTVLDLPMTELAKHSTTIIRGVVISQKPGWDREHKNIVTRIRVRVEETLRGTVKARRQVVVEQAGGELDDVGQSVEGSASFKVGEEVLLFLEAHRANASEFSLVSLSASKFTIARDASGAHVTRDVSGLTFVTRQADGHLRPSPATPDGALTLEGARATIREALGTARPSAHH